MSAPAESVILCEGFHDRAFWAGWLLERLHWKDARPRRPDGSYGLAVDPFSKNVTQGQFAYRSNAGIFLRVWPCHGDSKVLAALSRRLRERTTNGLRHLVANLDTDANDGDAEAAQIRADGLVAAVEHRVREADPYFTRTSEGDFMLDSGATLVTLVLWGANDLPTPELPSKNTLERLVCAALRSVYPQRAANVETWLRTRHDPPSGSAGLAKEHAWSHMAGWYGAQGCDDFYHAIWRDSLVASQLESRLRDGGVARIVEALAASAP